MAAERSGQRHREARQSRPTPPAPPHATMGLLDYLTKTSLDEDYAHVSSRRTASGGRPSRPGRAALVVLLMFGLLVATAALKTSRSADESATSRASLIDQANARKAGLDARRKTLATLQREVVSARAANLAATRDGRTVNARVRRLGLAAGSLPARGPGVRVVVDDSPDADSAQERVQAPDLQKLVNGLWQVGAEAVAVNGQRLTALSPIREAAGAITVNFRSLRPPYTISAIGDPDTMAADLLDTTGGQVMVTLQSSFGLQFDVDTLDTMLLPAARPATLRVARRPASDRPGSQPSGDAQ